MKRTIKVPNNIDRFDLLRLIYEQLSANLLLSYSLTITNNEFVSIFGDASQHYTKEEVRNFLYNYKLFCDYSDLNSKTEVRFNSDSIVKADFDLFKEYCSKFSKGELENEMRFADYKNQIFWSKSNLRVKRIYIEDFRILDEFCMELNSNISVLIGENGSGKSSILYLVSFLLASFRLYKTENPKITGIVELEYDLINGDEKRTIVLRNDSRLFFKPLIMINSSRFMDYDHSFALYLPSDIVVSYAGITKELADLVKLFETRFVGKINRSKTSFSLNPFFLPTNNFYYSRPEYLSFVFLAMLFADNSMTQYLYNMLKFSNDDKLGCCFKFKPGPRYEEYKRFPGSVAPQFFTELNTTNADWELIGNIAINDLFTSFKDNFSPREVFDVLYYLYHNELISTIEVNWGVDYKKSLNNLSEGQKQELMTLGLSLIFEKSNTLFLLDEPDNSLHPKWQREFISSLTKATANGSCAIVTTHSPLMLGNAEKAEVHILDDGKLQENTPKYYGKDNNAILYDLMGVGRRVKAIEKKISLLSDFIEKEDLPNAQKLYNELEDLLESDDPDLIRANAMLDYLKDEEFDNETNI